MFVYYLAADILLFILNGQPLLNSITPFSAFKYIKLALIDQSSARHKKLVVGR
jgi:hypothetical protein